MREVKNLSSSLNFEVVVKYKTRMNNIRINGLKNKFNKIGDVFLNREENELELTCGFLSFPIPFQFSTHVNLLH